MRLQRACELFIEHCGSAINLSEHTMRAYSGDLKHAQDFIGRKVELESIKKECLRQYMGYMRNELDLKESTIKRRVACLKLFFKWACHEAIIGSNPFDALNDRIRLPKRLPRTIDSADACKLRKITALSGRDSSYDICCKKVAIGLLLETGVRVGELSSINIDDVSLADRSIKIHGKGNRQRYVYFLSPVVADAVSAFMVRRKRARLRAEKLLVSHGGSHLTPPSVRRILREFAELAGISRKVTPHMLRHTCATQWLESGLDIRYVQKLLGHHSISTTEIYTHVSDQSLRDALLRANEGRGR